MWRVATVLGGVRPGELDRAGSLAGARQGLIVRGCGGWQAGAPERIGVTDRGLVAQRDHLTPLPRRAQIGSAEVGAART